MSLHNGIHAAIDQHVTFCHAPPFPPDAPLEPFLLDFMSDAQVHSIQAGLTQEPSAMPALEAIH